MYFETNKTKLFIVSEDIAINCEELIDQNLLPTTYNITFGINNSPLAFR